MVTIVYVHLKGKVTDMLKTFKAIIIVLSVSFLLTGCQNRKKEIQLESLCNTRGDYQYGKLEWESSPEQVEQMLGITLGDPAESSNVKIYTVVDAFVLNQSKATLVCEFKEGKLATVSFLIFPMEEEREKVWTQTAEALKAEYGDKEAVIRTSESEELQIVTEDTYYLWENNQDQHTTLQLFKLVVNEEFKYIGLTVSRLDQ